MASTDRGRRALRERALLKRVADHKQVYFASGWASYETALTGGIHLVPHNTRMQEIARDYELMADMFFGPYPRFDEILATLRALEAEINGG